MQISAKSLSGVVLGRQSPCRRTAARNTRRV